MKIRIATYGPAPTDRTSVSEKSRVLKVNRCYVFEVGQQYRQRAGGAAGRIVLYGFAPGCCVVWPRCSPAASAQCTRGLGAPIQTTAH